MRSDAVTARRWNPANWYVSIEDGVGLRYCSHGGACGAADFAGAPRRLGMRRWRTTFLAGHPPFLLDPALASDVLIGTCRVWRGMAQSGGAWPGSDANPRDVWRGAACT